MSCSCTQEINLQHLSVHGCFERGLKTRRLPSLPVVGERVTGGDGLWVVFSLQFESGRLADIRFDASTCTTLIAYCQALAEIIRDTPLGTIPAFDCRQLVTALPGIPGAKHDRAILATAAFRAAAMHLPRENTNESSLHLRDAETHGVVRAGPHDPAAA